MAGLEGDLERLLATMANSFAAQGKAREVAILAHSRSTIDQTGYEDLNGGTYYYAVTLFLPDHLYAQVSDSRKAFEQQFRVVMQDLARVYDSEYIQAFVLASELVQEEGWRDRAKAWVSGEGISNQGRARSDNVAPLMADGLLFRSHPEIHLYRAFKAAGVTFAPLPVFVRGGETYRRIEPDFVVLKDGVVMIVEVDGDTVHRESPLDAHNRSTMMLHEGATVERVNASECNTLDKAKVCAAKILNIISKLKANK